MRAVRRLFLMTNTGTDAYFGITTGRIHSDLGEYHVISLFANAAEPLGLKNPNQTFVGDRAKLWHAPAEGVKRLAGYR